MQTYLCHNYPMVDLIEDVHSDLVLSADLQHPVVAGGNTEPCKERKPSHTVIQCTHYCSTSVHVASSPKWWGGTTWRPAVGFDVA